MCFEQALYTEPASWSLLDAALPLCKAQEVI